jgi:hypothetical protein
VRSFGTTFRMGDRPPTDKNARWKSSGRLPTRWETPSPNGPPTRPPLETRLLVTWDNYSVGTAINENRQDLVRQGRRLEYFTIVWNSLEALVSIIAGLAGGSVAVVGFGLDSLIEATSGAALLWRLHHDLNPSRREQVEGTTLRIIGWSFIVLASYILYESGSTLIRHESPERSIPGIMIAAAAVAVMPLLARAKGRVAAGIVAMSLNETFPLAVTFEEFLEYLGGQ